MYISHHRIIGRLLQDEETYVKEVHTEKSIKIKEKTHTSTHCTLCTESHISNFSKNLLVKIKGCYVIVAQIQTSKICHIKSWFNGKQVTMR